MSKLCKTEEEAKESVRIYEDFGARAVIGSVAEVCARWFLGPPDGETPRSSNRLYECAFQCPIRSAFGAPKHPLQGQLVSGRFCSRFRVSRSRSDGTSGIDLK